jgi:cysteine desulfurase
VLDTMRELERQGFEVTYLDVQEDGLLDLNRLKDAIRPDTSATTASAEMETELLRSLAIIAIL